MKKVLSTLGGVLVLLIIAVLVVPPLIPASAYKRALVDRISAAIGRRAQIGGAVGFRILPEPSFFAEKIALANPPGAIPTNMITIGKVSVRVPLVALLAGDVVVRSLVLRNPVIHLSVDRNGRPNWRFREHAGGPATASGARRAGKRGALRPPRELTLGDVRIVDGKVTYANARTGEREEVDAVNLRLSLPSLDRPLAATGSVVWHKQKIALALRLIDLGLLFADRPAAVYADVTARWLKLSFKGTLRARQPFGAHGMLAVATPSLPRLAAWAGTPLSASGSTFGPLKIEGKAAFSGAKIALHQAVFSLDAIKGNGDLRFDDRGPRPYVAATLFLGKVDLGPYLAARTTAPAPPSSAPSPPNGTPPPPAGTPVSHGRSPAPTGFAPLTRVDGKVDLTLAGLAMRNWTLGPSHASIILKDGRLAANLDRVALYGGNANARVDLNAGATPTVTFSCNLSGVQLQPLLAAAAGTEMLGGAASLALQVTGHGRSRDDILSTLSGSGRIDIRNGVIEGGDIVAMTHRVASALHTLSAVTLPVPAGESEKTVFSRLTGSYTIGNGIVANNDLSLQSPLFRANGRGSVNLVQRTLDYRLDVKPSSPTKIRIGGVTLSELVVPIIVTGPWEHPAYRPDVDSILRTIANEKGLKGLERKIPGGKIDEDLERLLHTPPGGHAGPKARDILRQLLGH